MADYGRIGIISINGTEKLATFNEREDAILIDVPQHMSARGYLDRLIAQGNLRTAIEAVASHTVDLSSGTFQFETAFGNPEKILCVGVNYPSRNEEYKDGQEAPQKPSLFIRFPDSFTGHRQNLERPHASHQLDYEGELVIIIGKGGRHITEAGACDHIAALSLANEGTLRDWVRHAKFNVTQGKNFDRSGSLGPWLVPFVTPEQIRDVRLTTHVNGALRQDDRTANMVFSIPFLIAYISTFTTLKSGDVILTGTPTGAGARLDPPQWLKPGDRVNVSIEGIGTLCNGVEDEKAE